jgi:N-methylhydantoinase A
LKTKEAKLFEIAIDTGGTFTDAVLTDEKQKVSVSKVETTPADPAKGIMNCISGVADIRQVTLPELLGKTNTITIGTTLATNAILEGKGARC